jgi:ComF family protein
MALNRLVAPLCQTCGTPQAIPVERCNFCEILPDLLTVRSVARYDGSLLKAILQLKYRANQRLAEMMASWMAEVYHREKWSGSLISAVPLGKRRMRRRGYNQAELIAKELASKLGLPRSIQALKRIHETQSQVGLDPTQRRKNVENAFYAEDSEVRSQNVVLIDDLLTTGATISACSVALVRSGARKVFALTIARA